MHCLVVPWLTSAEPELLRLQLYEPTARKQALAEPMILSSHVKIAAFDPQESVPRSLSADLMVVNSGDAWLGWSTWVSLRVASHQPFW